MPKCWTPLIWKHICLTTVTVYANVHVQESSTAMPAKLSSVKCCYFKPETQQKPAVNSKMTCLASNERTDYKWCYMCRDTTCNIMGMEVMFRSTGGIKTSGFVSHWIEDGCRFYDESVGDIRALSGHICFCREKDFCNTEFYPLVGGPRDPDSTKDHEGPRKFAPADHGRGSVVFSYKASVIVVFILAGLCAIFTIVCCLICQQAACKP